MQRVLRRVASRLLSSLSDINLATLRSVTMLAD